MNKSLLIFSFVLISLLAIGCVSAADGTNITDDYLIQEASSDFNEQLETDSGDDIEYESSPEEVEIISNGENKDTPIINIENTTVSQYDPKIIPFNVTDSRGNLISGEAIVTVYDENEISKYVILYNGAGMDSLKQLDLDKLFEFNNGLDLVSVYNIIYSSMNKTNFNPDLLIDGITDVYGGINLNVSKIIVDLVDNSIIDLSQTGEKLKVILSGLNTTNLYFLYNLSDAVHINKTAFANALDISLNKSIENIKQFIQNKLNLTISPEIEAKMNYISNGPEILKLHDVLTVIKDIYISNNLKMHNIVNILDNLTDGNVFDIPKIIHKILDSNATFIKSLPKVIKSFSINITQALEIYNNVKDNFNFNISDGIVTLSYITGINATTLSNIIDGIKDIYSGITFNKTYTSGWIKSITAGNYTNIANKILNISQLNTSSIKSGFDKIIPEINFKLSTLFIVGEILKLYGGFNSSKILGGLDKIIIGFGADVSTVISKLFDKIGYSVRFPFELYKPGTYNVSVKYLGNDFFNSAVKMAKLIINPNENFIIHSYINLPEMYGENTTFDVYLMDGFENDISREVNVYLNDEKIGSLKTDERGYGVYTLSNLTNGKYYIEFEYEGVYDGIDFIINIPPIETNITYSDMKTVTVNTKVDGKIGKYFKVTLNDENGKTLANKEILIGYEGKTIKGITDENGTYKLQINIQKAGTYTIAACYLGDTLYSASYITSKITVKKQTAKLIAKKQTFKVKAKKKTVKAIFKSAKGHLIKGKEIKFTVKGKTYTAKTNSKGVASVNVKLAKKGTYKVTVKFAGDSTYNKVTKKITWKIK